MAWYRELDASMMIRLTAQGLGTTAYSLLSPTAIVATALRDFSNVGNFSISDHPTLQLHSTLVASFYTAATQMQTFVSRPFRRSLSS